MFRGDGRRLRSKLLSARGKRVRRGRRHPLRDTTWAHLVAHDGRGACVSRAVGLEVGELASILLRHSARLEAGEALLLRRFGARRRKHARILPGRAGDGILTGPRPL